jgi:hypothetical protein
MFQIKVLEKMKTHLCSKLFFWGSCLLWDNVEKYGRARWASDDNIMLHRKDALCMLDSWGYRHILRIFLEIFYYFVWSTSRWRRYILLKCWNTHAPPSIVTTTTTKTTTTTTTTTTKSNKGAAVVSDQKQVTGLHVHLKRGARTFYVLIVTHIAGSCLTHTSFTSNYCSSWM